MIINSVNLEVFQQTCHIRLRKYYDEVSLTPHYHLLENIFRKVLKSLPTISMKKKRKTFYTNKNTNMYKQSLVTAVQEM
jgi:hypothetical protein